MRRGIRASSSAYYLSDRTLSELAEDLLLDTIEVYASLGGSSVPGVVCILPWSPKNLCHFLLTMLVLVGALSPAYAEQKLQPVSDGPYKLHFFHAHTGERLSIIYRNSQGYDQQSLARLNQYLRDHRTGEVHEYDPQVFDLLHDLTAALGNPDLEIDVVCGYRTQRSNEFLRTHGHGVARHSLHMQAMAIDIRVPGIPTLRLRDAALALQRGGVGYYAASDFVHVDVGRVRRW
jgi:uncharacterized protein YcbK (DUF882 family)